MITEEVEVKVNEAAASSAHAAGSLFEGLRKLALASVGAAAMTREEVEEFVNRLVARGEIAQQDAERLLREMRERGKPSAPSREQIEDRIESRVEQVLNRLNIPSKRDVDDLSVKIAQLAARVEELRKKELRIENREPAKQS